MPPKNDNLVPSTTLKRRIDMLVDELYASESRDGVTNLEKVRPLLRNVLATATKEKCRNDRVLGPEIKAALEQAAIHKHYVLPEVEGTTFDATFMNQFPNRVESTNNMLEGGAGDSGGRKRGNDNSPDQLRKKPKGSQQHQEDKVEETSSNPANPAHHSVAIQGHEQPAPFSGGGNSEERPGKRVTGGGAMEGVQGAGGGAGEAAEKNGDAEELAKAVEGEVARPDDDVSMDEEPAASTMGEEARTSNEAHPDTIPPSTDNTAVGQFGRQHKLTYALLYEWKLTSQKIESLEKRKKAIVELFGSDRCDNCSAAGVTGRCLRPASFSCLRCNAIHRACVFPNDGVRTTHKPKRPGRGGRKKSAATVESSEEGEVEEQPASRNTKAKGKSHSRSTIDDSVLEVPKQKGRASSREKSTSEPSSRAMSQIPTIKIQPQRFTRSSTASMTEGNGFQGPTIVGQREGGTYHLYSTPASSRHVSPYPGQNEVTVIADGPSPLQDGPLIALASQLRSEIRQVDSRISSLDYSLLHGEHLGMISQRSSLRNEFLNHDDEWKEKVELHINKTMSALEQWKLGAVVEIKSQLEEVIRGQSTDLSNSIEDQISARINNLFCPSQLRGTISEALTNCLSTEFQAYLTAHKGFFHQLIEERLDHGLRAFMDAELDNRVRAIVDEKVKERLVRAPVGPLEASPQTQSVLDEMESRTRVIIGESMKQYTRVQDNIERLETRFQRALSTISKDVAGHQESLLSLWRDMEPLKPYGNPLMQLLGQLVTSMPQHRENSAPGIAGPSTLHPPLLFEEQPRPQTPSSRNQDFNLSSFLQSTPAVQGNLSTVQWEQPLGFEHSLDVNFETGNSATATSGLPSMSDSILNDRILYFQPPKQLINRISIERIP
ncbi:hypothetical protein CC1G_03994 [Coprinopsis cinerea okayama7|uniref:Uncharacterized protein n=1 Tax=Coprinopsis cinerea (strain Okayama-7 / 130 / ATCC MYA-4618 / FGSC 9003) TaxID=240176 RepID=A8N8E7_COPC7|nr:hypothetical protein CC1G_03994 [Coprinopsis cinerea okayama7\|eukprot:XP_001831103.2 hypothetical protein CC1G_03994 [Coprinopsis cinerea okayama7\